MLSCIPYSRFLFDGQYFIHKILDWIYFSKHFDRSKIWSILGEIVINDARQLIPSLRHVLLFTHAQLSKRARARELHSVLCHRAVLCSLSVLYLSSNKCLATPGARDGSLLELLQQPRRSGK